MTDRVVLLNPHNHHDPQGIPADSLGGLVKPHTVTLAPHGYFDYLKNMEVSADHPALSPGDGDRYVYAEPLSESGGKIPLFDGRPGAGQVIDGALNDSETLLAIRAVARTHPEIIEEMLRKNGDGSVSMRIHEPKYNVYDNYSTEPTGRVFDIRMSPDLPVDPATGHS